MKKIKTIVAVFSVLAAGTPSVVSISTANAGEPAAYAAKPRAVERVPLVMPAITIEDTLAAAASIITKGTDGRTKPSLVSLQWNGRFQDGIRFAFHTSAYDTPSPSRWKRGVPGTLFLDIKVNSVGQTRGLQPWRPIALPSNIPHQGDLVYNKDLLPIEEPFMHPDAVVRALQDALTIDLGLDARRRLCRYDSVQFKLMPTLTLYRWAITPFGYSGLLELYADHGNRQGMPSAGCKYGARVSLGIDPVTGEFLVRDYNDGLAQIQYAASRRSGPKAKGKKSDGAALLIESFQMFDNLFARSWAVMLDESTDTDSHGFTIPNKVKGWSAESVALTLEMEGSRLKSIQEAVRLEPRLAMGHAALGLLLTRDCEQEKPSVAGNCEKGIRSLLKARELAPQLAFPAYVLVNRASNPFFPENLRPLLKENASVLCDKVRGFAPAWDWAYYSTCGFRGDRWGKWERDDVNIRRIKGIPIIRPADILLGYLSMELAK